MTLAQLRTFLRLDLGKALLFLMFFLLALGGTIQSWAFGDGFRPKPILYDLLRPLPLWPLATLLLAPLLCMSAPLLALGIDLTSPDTWYGLSAVALYLYLVACGCVTALTWMRQQHGP